MCAVGCALCPVGSCLWLIPLPLSSHYLFKRSQCLKSYGDMTIIHTYTHTHFTLTHINWNMWLRKWKKIWGLIHSHTLNGTCAYVQGRRFEGAQSTRRSSRPGTDGCRLRSAHRRQIPESRITLHIRIKLCNKITYAPLSDQKYISKVRLLIKEINFRLNGVIIISGDEMQEEI